MRTDLLHFNGLDASTGGFAVAPRSAARVVRDLGRRVVGLEETVQWKGPRHGVDVRKLREAGWAVIFHRDADPAVRAALKPLLALRREQAGGTEVFRDFAGFSGYWPRESASDFLARQGLGPGAFNPEQMPFYVLLVGGPEEIPFSFQFQLDVLYAVGRLAFERVEDYALYARTVVKAEAGELRRRRALAVVAPRNPDDQATALSMGNLVAPVVEHLLAKAKKARRARRFRVETDLGDDATKAALLSRLGGDDAPAMAFTVSHGLSFSPDHPRQRAEQGALVCQDWPGPQGWNGPLPAEFFVTAADITDDRPPAGQIACHFACFSAGTPERDEFAHGARKRPARIAAQPFVAALPQRLLAHPEGGALAVIGHVERAWGYSFFWKHLGRQAQAFEALFEGLFAGWPVGAAMESFADRLAALAVELAAAVEAREYGQRLQTQEIRTLWSVHNDAKCYALLGDPAVKAAL